MDSNAPGTVAKGTAITSLGAALVGGLYGAARRGNIRFVALSSALNGALVGSAFFGLREFVVSPILVLNLSSPQYVRRKEELQNKKSKQIVQHHAQQLSWSDMRSHKLLDSSISGAATAATFSALAHGAAGVIPGVSTGAIVCSLLQLAYNEVGVRRIQYVSRKLAERNITPEVAIVSETNSQKTYTVLPPPEPSRPFWERFCEYIGLAKVSDEEYLEKLKAKRASYLQQIAEIEAEREKKKNGSAADESTRP
ncbi:hypothetical protein BDW22DRAFT_1354257 [Trametopsis cervina]|nr:hypothetical protein BDW22DRAFT_1354257 [Trametopsis cervina]